MITRSRPGARAVTAESLLVRYPRRRRLFELRRSAVDYRYSVTCPRFDRTTTSVGRRRKPLVLASAARLEMGHEVLTSSGTGAHAEVQIHNQTFEILVVDARSHHQLDLEEYCQILTYLKSVSSGRVKVGRSCGRSLSVQQRSMRTQYPRTCCQPFASGYSGHNASVANLEGHSGANRQLEASGRSWRFAVWR
jgi:hypothetical protein